VLQKQNKKKKQKQNRGRNKNSAIAGSLIAACLSGRRAAWGRGKSQNYASLAKLLTLFA